MIEPIGQRIDEDYRPARPRDDGRSGARIARRIRDFIGEASEDTQLSDAAKQAIRRDQARRLYNRAVRLAKDAALDRAAAEDRYGRPATGGPLCAAFMREQTDE